MNKSQTGISPKAFSGNLITDFYEHIRDAGREFDAETHSRQDRDVVTPDFRFPDPTPATADFFRAATVHWQDFGTYKNRPLYLLNLAANPGTRTTKTFASLLIVARAVEHIRTTGERVIIFSPTSANKGTALRDAVQRAIDCGLVTPEELRIVVLAPETSAGKLRRSRLSDNPVLAALNPVLTLNSPVPEDVKTLGKEFVDRYGEKVRQETGALIWYTLELNNYLIADMARAFFEHSAAPLDATDRPRTHVHAVSSAFGLLGYHRGRQYLEERGLSDAARRPRSLLVQHLHTPDMVLHACFGSFDASHIPAYQRDDATGRYHQGSDPHFPEITDDPVEMLDRTFYTRRPATAPTMSEIIRTHGGGGIVVSRRECMDRYPELRSRLESAGFSAPDDPAEVREWSLMMALTGALNAVDRGFIGSGDDIVVHGSGWYHSSEYQPLHGMTRLVSTAADIARTIIG